MKEATLRIIAFCGSKGSGKDTAARMALKHIPGLSKRYSLAYPMKQVAKELFIWSDTHTDGPLKETTDTYWGISPREFLQQFGDFVRDTLPANLHRFGSMNGHDFWCRRLRNEIEGDYQLVGSESGYTPLICDLRFPNEEQFFRRASDDFALIHIIRPAQVKEDTHPSENLFSRLSPDYTIYNDASMERLEEKVVGVLSNLGVI